MQAKRAESRGGIRSSAVAPLPAATSPRTPFTTSTSTAFLSHNDVLIDVPPCPILDELSSLMEAGIPLHKLRDSRGRTPLHTMALHCSVALARQTIASPIIQPLDINAKDNTGVTALMFAARAKEPYGSYLCDALIPVSDVNAVDNCNKCALHYAIGQYATLEKLIKCGAQLNVAAKTDGYTPLMQAAAAGDTDSVGIIVKCAPVTGDNVLQLELKDAEGRTVEERCRLYSDLDASKRSKILTYLKHYRRRMTSSAAATTALMDEFGAAISGVDLTVHPYGAAAMRSSSDGLNLRI